MAQLKYRPGGGGSSGSEQFECPDWVGEGEGVAFVVTGGGWHVWHTTMISSEKDSAGSFGETGGHRKSKKKSNKRLTRCVTACRRQRRAKGTETRDY